MILPKIKEEGNGFENYYFIFKRENNQFYSNRGNQSGIVFSEDVKSEFESFRLDEFDMGISECEIIEFPD